ncbi:hypothetical protein [Solwaraspora sp. WMMD792]|uniref:hypothetical protein n=1 Tax=Solwaraspora sp. WMMD792 TaxID=3016099 RepID=UPI002417B9CD|nr:hypothetical protein [Solwaraspora sp. WMMD792]MDG4773010.1 hypothetical protein [Solwaraspora sp. WMMD792]
MQIPPDFVRDDAEGNPPLARMMRGGRGGEVRLKLYLSLTLLAVAGDNDINSKPARGWARLLDLSDPDVNGARRISDALGWLHSAKLLKLDRQPGLPPDITLLNPSGDGRRYGWRSNGRYINLPLDFWTQGWILSLSGAAVAVLLVLLEMQGGRTPDDPPWLTGAQRTRYGFSDDTWTRAKKELQSYGLLTVRRIPQARDADFDFRRLRDTYWLDLHRLASTP